MRPDEDFGLAPHEEDEGLFARDFDGQLIRVDAPTAADFGNDVTVQIDGKPVTVKAAEPMKDSQGNDIVDIHGEPTPRRTTILDAILKLNAARSNEEQISVPTLCHQFHLTPVAVCRLCVVQIARPNPRVPGELKRERKLLPACQHPVEPDMCVFTVNDTGRDGQRVKKSLRTLIELQLSEDVSSQPKNEVMAELNEIAVLAAKYEQNHSRFGPPFFEPKRRTAFKTSTAPVDTSSPVFTVDHGACIRCDRCVRACNEVMKNNVICRTGKGEGAEIGFDLNVPMFDSTCVQCGECMVSCPTSAITFVPFPGVRPIEGRDVSFEKLRIDPLFAGVPPKFLLWQKALVIEQTLRPGQVLCKEGDPGHSAFLIKSGELQITQTGSAAIPRRGVEDVIVGEMACLSGTPRTADVSAATSAVVWEIRRNVLDRMMRSPAQRARFQNVYRDHSLATALSKSVMFRSLSRPEFEKAVGFLASRLKFNSVQPGVEFLTQGKLADCMYLVRLGHVQVEARVGREMKEFDRGPGTVLGEIGILGIGREDLLRGKARVRESLLAAIKEGDYDRIRGFRTATCTALDHVELARIDRADFFALVHDFPSILNALIDLSFDRLGERSNPMESEFIQQGLYLSRNLLALDLTKCTRCDLCLQACVSKHGTASHGHPVSRLYREGKRFGDYLVASACRSCEDAYCMRGCPVDAIHRGKQLQIVIEDICIGCGLCERNCPYGNIGMEEVIAPGGPLRPRLKAATCDLCDSAGAAKPPVPSCVYACPHDAAHRMTGKELLDLVSPSSGWSSFD